MKSAQKTMALWAILIVVAILMFQVYEKERQLMIRNFDYPKFVTALEKGEVESVTFYRTEGKIEGQLKEEFDEVYKGRQFQIFGNVSDEGLKLLLKHGITPKYVSNENSMMVSLFLNWLPLIFIIGLFMFFMKQVQMGGGKAMSFGKSRAKMLTENKNKVTFKDVAGVEEAKQDLEEVVDFLKEPKKYTRLGGRIPKGVLLVGSPGTGKTLLARAVAGEADAPFFTISGSDFVEMFVGVGASRVRDLFEQGKKNAPCIIFIDEIDAVGRHRGAGMGGGHDEREQTLNQLLVEMDGFEGSEGVILIAATNRPDVLDPALLRPGRFDRQVVVNKPDVKGREQILSVHTRKTPLASDVNIPVIAKATPGFSGADLANLVNEAALQAARKNKHKVDMNDFEMAKDKVLMGAERKSMVISEHDKKVTAYHEAGHAIVGMVLPKLDPVHKVTIIPRGMALGLTQMLPEEDAVSLSKNKATNMIPYMFGGRAAEELIFKDYTTGAANDIERATKLARSMVCEWGMSELIGPISLEEKEGPVFLGMQNGQSKHHSEDKARQIDQEIDRFLKEGYEISKKVLTDKNTELVNMSEALLELETLEADELKMIMNGKVTADIVAKREEGKKILDAENKKAAEENRKKEAEEKLKNASKDDNGGSDPMGSPGPVTA
ncbi:MAG: ATP-dependent metallopeptidase FtsH/Yme1/Tma family protein [Bdellovibrionaceae bacterium]|jgi:cell division protease FtsH|nr:ATP-dependent metallopeptidase FtsH/Yme1/Tma family protein [Pseudobdellovibrionaceae bacterium]